MGWNGMKYSLVSRDWIADCVEMMAEAYAVVSRIQWALLYSNLP